MILDALVIGGGVSGAASGLLLAQAGWNVGIVEKKQFPRRKVCGEFVSATSLPLLQKLDIFDFYLNHCGPEIKHVALFAHDTILTAAMPAFYDTLPWGRAVRRDILDTELLENAVKAGVKVWQPSTAKHLRREDNSYICTVVNNNVSEEISARIIIIAHGSWEHPLISESINSHKSSDLLAFKAHFTNCNLPDDLMPLLVFPGGYGGLVHCAPELVTLSCCIRRDMLQKIRQQYSGMQANEGVFNHIIHTCHEAHKVLMSAQLVGEWLAIGPIRPGIRKHYDNGIFYVGNIAGESHPLVAEGISMAMQSAWLLSQILISKREAILSGKELNSAGQEYSKLWKANFSTRIYVAALFANIAMRPAMVKLLLPVIKKFPNLLTIGAKWSGKARQIILEHN